MSKASPATTPQNPPAEGRDFAVLAMILLFWAANFVAIKLGVDDFPVWTALALRFSLISLLLVPFVRYPKGHFLPLLLLALVLIPGHFGFLFWSIQQTSSVGAISIVIQLNPAFSVLLAWLIFKDVPGIKRVSGLLIAFVGVVVLFYEPNFFSDLTPLIAALASAFFMGIYTVMVRGRSGIPPLAIICWTSVMGVPFCFAMALIFEQNLLTSISGASLGGWAGITYAAIGSSIIAHGSWAWLLRRQPISFLAPFTLAVPVLAVFITAIVFDETITLHMVFAGLIVLAGIGLITFSKAYR